MMYALVKGGFVVNIIVWDGVSSYTPPAGHDLVAYAAGCVIGGTWDGVDFGPIPEPAP
ncbi:hypothetical protein [Sphingomonas sp.]|uniref:hypothetical protein n=1 Tax=Sphingomonas sp. TaxID=28214 RepID=UPI0035663C6F